MTTATEFARIAQSLHAECHRLGLVAPAFRAPPHTTAPRTIRRLAQGVVVAVRLDRDVHAIARDMVDGCVAANPQLPDSEMEHTRNLLWVAAGEAVTV